jgi:ubiquinone/menaquinone biosynthesis C-methylase UbiE
MNSEPTRQDYFDELSGRWDGFTDGERVRKALRIALPGMRIRPDEHIVDLGCGTGNLTAVLTDVLGPMGTVTAVDFASAMIDVARDKISDGRVRWLVADVVQLPLDAGSVDRVICYSAWPHFPDHGAAARELHRVLRPGGMLHVLHIDSRDKINAIHGGVGGAIGKDVLPPARELADVLTACGFAVQDAMDTAEAYRIDARKPA